MKYKQYFFLMALLLNFKNANAQSHDLNELLDRAFDLAKDSVQYASELELMLTAELFSKEILVSALEDAKDFNSSVGFDKQNKWIVAIPLTAVGTFALTYVTTMSNQAINAVTPSADKLNKYNEILKNYKLVKDKIEIAKLDVEDIKNRIVPYFLYLRKKNYAPGTEEEINFQKLSVQFPERMDKTLASTYEAREKVLKELEEEKNQLLRLMKKPGRLYKMGLKAKFASKLAIGFGVFAAGVTVIDNVSVLMLPEYSDKLLQDLREDIQDLESTLYPSDAAFEPTPLPQQ